jgi:hypothetical protein
MMWIAILIFIIGCLVAWYYVLLHDSAFLDKRTGRWYRYVRQSDNPHHKMCPMCLDESRANSCPVIYTTTNKHRYGVYCHEHEEVWFDLYKKGDMK